MVDIVSPEIRSRMMSGIRSVNTKPEMLIRKALHAKDFRYRIHHKKLPGKPDLVLNKYKAVIFTHGCFWHGHDCQLFKLPATNIQFWKDKIDTNRRNDILAQEHLLKTGWRVLVIWECSLKGKARLTLNEVISRTSAWLLSDADQSEIRGYYVDK